MKNAKRSDPKIAATKLLPGVKFVLDGPWWVVRSRNYPEANGQGRTPEAAYASFVSSVHDIAAIRRSDRRRQARP